MVLASGQSDRRGRLTDHSAKIAKEQVLAQTIVMAALARAFQ